MHQRRAASSYHAHVHVVTTALLERWWTVTDLSVMLGMRPRTVAFCVQAIARQRYVFKRQDAYRLYPEARGVRSGPVVASDRQDLPRKTSTGDKSPMRGDFDEDELDDFEPDGLDEDDICIDCQRFHSCEDVCCVCGAPMCFACFEMGAGVCKGPHR